MPSRPFVGGGVQDVWLLTHLAMVQTKGHPRLPEVKILIISLVRFFVLLLLYMLLVGETKILQIKRTTV